MEINKIYNENCLNSMAHMPDNFIDLTVTSPPYDQIRNYKKYFFDFESIAKELFRVMKTGGVVVWVVGDQTIDDNETGTSFKQALYFKEIGFNLHDTMIYIKDPRFPRSNGYGNSFDYMFILSKRKIKTFNPIKRQTLNKGIKKLVTNRQKNGNLLAKRYTSPNESSLYNVWYYSSGYMKSSTDKMAFEHPAVFPEQLAIDHILSWSNEGDLVYDPFGGSGTTAIACHILKRNWILSEISSKYCELIEKRLDPYLRQQDLL